MTLHLKMPSKVNNLSPKISVIGVGGAGGNIINSMIESGVKGVEFLNVNTDSQQLKHSQEEKTLQLGPTCTQGLGAGADPDMGKKAAEEVSTEIEEYLENSNMVFLTAGMGGGTGTGATPVIAKIAKELNILTVGVVTKPFDMEGKRRFKQAESGILELQKYVDNLIIIPNQNIFHSAKPDTSFSDALHLANAVLIDGVRSIIDLMVKPGIMNHDFADVRAIMSETGKVHLGTGISEGENRATEATENAISNPLLEYNSMNGAKGVLINITCGKDTSLHEIDLAVNKVKEESDENANLIFGVQKDPDYEGKFKISVISTGIDSENYYKNIIKNEKITNISEFKTNTLSDDDNNEIEEPNIEQSSFFVDHESSSGFKVNIKSNQKKETKDFEKKNELDVETKQVEKKSLFSILFGSKKPKNNNDQNLQNNLNKDSNLHKGSKQEFKTEFQEILEEQKDEYQDGNKLEKKINKDDDLESTFLKRDSINAELPNEPINTRLDKDKNEEPDLSSFDSTNEKNNLDDEALQIPAFLRRQAN